MASVATGAADLVANGVQGRTPFSSDYNPYSTNWMIKQFDLDPLSFLWSVMDAGMLLTSLGTLSATKAGTAAGAARSGSAGVAAKTVDEAGALVRYDPAAASRNLLGQVGEGYARTPSGYTVSAHAAERIVYGAPGRSPTTLSRVDDILKNPTRTMMRPNGTVRVYQGKDWVAVRDNGQMHIVTVMVR
ncbi:hypothetical protein [Aeromicrobium sp. P5_D10]